ncbi:hypothetical protein J6590_068591 [Homalodisca vitripennis]|nr:hypothetical protein J6590_068591 [Homalodisca vitripennis]
MVVVSFNFTHQSVTQGGTVPAGCADEQEARAKEGLLNPSLRLEHRHPHLRRHITVTIKEEALRTGSAAEEGRRLQISMAAEWKHPDEATRRRGNYLNQNPG